PLYRWLAGGLHLVFGDSSLGEEYLNGAGLTAMALFSYAVTRAFAGPRWGLAAAAFTLALFVAGPGFVVIQNGLSEVASAGFVYVGALCAMRGREGSLALAAVAGVCAVLGFYTRLNNLPFAMAIVLFAWPISDPIAKLYTPAVWVKGASAATVAIVCSAIGAG